MNSIPYFVDLKNEHEFNYYCAQKSLAAFETTLHDRSFLPSRFSFLTLLLTETFSTPFYLASKLTQVAIYIFRILNTKAEEEKPIHLRSLFHLMEAGMIQMLVPCVCTVIRICATTMGFFSPYWAIYGWKFAENGECLSHLLWINVFKEIAGQQYYQEQVYEEIIPSNAIFYLGEMQVRLSLASQFSDSTLEQKISFVFSQLLLFIAVNDPNFFYKLFDYDKTVDLKKMISADKPNFDYRLNSNVKQILLQLKSTLKENPTHEWIIQQIETQISIEDKQQLFCHIYLHVRLAFLKNKVHFNQVQTKNYFTQLQDLFSQRFRFGRAHFYQALNNLHCSTSD